LVFLFSTICGLSIFAVPQTYKELEVIQRK
jgi:hypothetical protein